MRISRIALTLAVLAPMGLRAQEDVRKQLDELKKQVAVLEEKAKDQEKTLTKVETKVAQDNISWGGDLRTRFDSAQWHFKPYQQFLGFVQNPSPSASNPYPFMPVTQQVGEQDYDNSTQWSTRLRLRMGMAIGEHGKIFGRLTMYKIHGGADVPIFNGSPNTVANSFNSGKVPGNDTLRVERASFVYDWPSLGVLSIGRQNTSDGPPFEVREGGERQATPQALAVNAMVDGIGWKFHLDKLGFPEHSLLGFCYGVGYESGFGGGGLVKSTYAPVGFNFSKATMANPAGATMQVNQIGNLKDSTVLGAMLDVPLLFEGFGTVHSANVYLGFNRFGNMTDIPFGQLNNFPVPAQPGMGGMPSIQYVTATNNLGDMDQITATWKHKVGDSFTYFASFGSIKSRPNGKTSQYGAYWDMPAAMGGPNVQLTGFGGLLGDANKSQTATAYYVGLRWDARDNLGFGLEFNHGSPKWFTYSPATGEATEKLSTRGDVVEAYVHWEFVKNVALRVGYLDYKYTHAFSGWHIAPAPMAGSWESAYNLDNNPMLQYAAPSGIKNTYVSLEVKF
ncbi:DUF3373 family protein [Mesoterricola silvestris]|uniref:DUF3373 domain-containing protein n=1 Tax=Mesoterricola silvestris TaxID=2927979 RepID=A0AA48GP30_9BACT|nr:DUF3373 family protein [Mesoterricola silvestris]BDU73484.1 hypothetical protein METEAL_26580 [Mesoterricola silvestris]